jgi:hypothetical protein
MANKMIAESTSSVEEFSPISTFHASPEAAFPNPLDLTLASVLHIVSLSIEDDGYCSPIAVISLISIGPVKILLPKASNSNVSLAILATQLTDIGQLCGVKIKYYHRCCRISLLRHPVSTQWPAS